MVSCRRVEDNVAFFELLEKIGTDFGMTTLLIVIQGLADIMQ